MTPAGAPTVFVIDDDAGVRASIQGLLKSVGLRSETFGTAQSSYAASGRTVQAALVSRRETSWSQRPGLSSANWPTRRPNTHYLRHRSWRYSLTVRAMKSGAVEFLTQALPGPGLAGCDSSGFGS